MPQKITDLLADKDYTPPAPPVPSEPLTEAQKTKVKARITEVLKNGPGVKDARTDELIPGGPQETWKLVHFVAHQSRLLDGIEDLTASHIMGVIGEMKAEGDFAPGYGGNAVVAKPEPLPE